MKLKSFVRIALSAVLISGLGVATVGITSSDAYAAPKKKVVRKKSTSAAKINLANKSYTGILYTHGEPEVELYFMPGFVCSIKIGEMVAQGTYKVTGNTVTIKYWDGTDMTMKFDIKNGGSKLYYEEATSRNLISCELDLVK